MSAYSSPDAHANGRNLEGEKSAAVGKDFFARRAPTFRLVEGCAQANAGVELHHPAIYPLAFGFHQKCDPGIGFLGGQAVAEAAAYVIARILGREAELEVFREKIMVPQAVQTTAGGIGVFQLHCAAGDDGRHHSGTDGYKQILAYFKYVLGAYQPSGHIDFVPVGRQGFDRLR